MQSHCATTYVVLLSYIIERVFFSSLSSSFIYLFRSPPSRSLATVLRFVGTRSWSSSLCPRDANMAIKWCFVCAYFRSRHLSCLPAPNQLPIAASHNYIQIDSYIFGKCVNLTESESHFLSRRFVAAFEFCSSLSLVLSFFL